MPLTLKTISNENMLEKTINHKFILIFEEGSYLLYCFIDPG